MLLSFIKTGNHHQQRRSYHPKKKNPSIHQTSYLNQVFFLKNWEETEAGSPACLVTPVTPATLCRRSDPSTCFVASFGAGLMNRCLDYNSKRGWRPSAVALCSHRCGWGCVVSGHKESQNTPQLQWVCSAMLLAGISSTIGVVVIVVVVVVVNFNFVGPKISRLTILDF